MLNRLLPLLLITWLYNQYHPYEWGSITSLITPTGIQIANNGTVYASTSGGLLEFDPATQEFNFIKMDDGLIYLDLTTIEIDDRGRLWLGGAYPNGYLQVYDSELGIVREITHLNSVSEIKMIKIGSHKAYAVYYGTTSGDVGILEFDLDEEGLPDYHDYYINFNSAPITEIKDFVFHHDSLLYVTSDQGIFVGNNSDNLKLSGSWEHMYDGKDAIKYLPDNDDIIIGGHVITDSIMFNINTNSSYDIFNRWPYCQKPDSEGNLVLCPSPKLDNYCEEYKENDTDSNLGKCGSDIISVKWHDQKYELLLGQVYIVIDEDGNEDFKLEIPFSEWKYFRSKYTSIAISADKRILGMDKYGLLSLDINSSSYQLYAPNTPHSNKFHAITITSSGNLAAVSKTGLLVAENNYGHDFNYDNLISYPDYKYFPKNDEQNSFNNITLLYHSGEYPTHSIIEGQNGDLIFGNSYLRHKLTWYDFPAVIALNPLTYEFESYDTTDQIIDGYWGIASEYKNMNMQINEISEDKHNNIWVTNPYCERYGHLLAIKSINNGSWSHVTIPDSSSYRPQTIAFDQLNQAWIGFVHDVLNDGTIYSNGGIKIFNPSESSWISISNQDLLPGNEPTASVWSLVFDEMDFLWVMNEKGIRGFTFSIQNNNISLNPLLKAIDGSAIDFLSNISYTKGNRIRVDSQNNKWVITHQGVWIIQESMAFWPSDEGLHPHNSGLLSEIVYDVAFDNDRGLAYLATDKGISILEIPFAENPSKQETLYISPNPFIIPDDIGVIIKNFPAGANIKILTISGLLIKEFHPPANQSQLIWDGTDEYGRIVGTAIYLVGANHPTENNLISKIAVIRK